MTNNINGIINPYLFTDEEILSMPKTEWDKYEALMLEYEEYKQNWLTEHGYTTFDYFNKVMEYVREEEEFSGQSYDLEDFGQFFRDWENDVGFDGEIWASYEEWFSSEKC